MTLTNEKPILVQNDPWLSPYENIIGERIKRYEEKCSELALKNGGISQFTKAYTYFGVNYDAKKKGWWYREWAPEAISLALIGDFNDWNLSLIHI